LGFTLGEIRQMIAVEEGDADSKTLSLSREKCLEQIELLKKQKAELEEGLSELYRIHSQLSGKIADKDRRTGSRGGCGKIPANQRLSVIRAPGMNFSRSLSLRLRKLAVCSWSRPHRHQDQSRARPGPIRSSCLRPAGRLRCRDAGALHLHDPRPRQGIRRLGAHAALL